MRLLHPLVQRAQLARPGAQLGPNPNPSSNPTPNPNPNPNQTCQLPALSHVSPASGPTGHATLLTVHGSGFYAAGALITYTKQVLGSLIRTLPLTLP